jgi:hypothetical protein
MTPSELEYTQQQQRATLLLLNAGLDMMGLDDAIRAYRTCAFLMRDLRGDTGAKW